MDLSKISTEDLQAIQGGHWDKVSTPGLQAYQAQRQHLAQAQEQAKNPQVTPDAADKAAHPNQPTTPPDQPSDLQTYLKKGLGAFSSFQRGVVKGATLGNVDPGGQPAKDHPTLNSLGSATGGLLPGAAMGALAGPAGGVMGRLSQNTGIGAALGGLAKPGEDETRTGNALMGGFVAGTGSAALEGLSAAGGKLGDYLMQKGVGMRKLTPGVGTQLADQGLIGTKGMMANQVEDKLPQAEGEVQRVVAGMQGSAPGNEITDAVSGKGTKFLNPDTGLPFEGKETSYNQVKDLSDKLGQTKSYSPEALLKLKRASDYEGYTASGTPATSLKAEMEQAQANKARELLENMSGGSSRQALAKEQALILARKALTRPDSISQNPVAAALFSKIPGSSLAASAGGQLSTKAGQAAGALTDPTTLQSLLGALKGANQ